MRKLFAIIGILLIATMLFVACIPEAENEEEVITWRELPNDDGYELFIDKDFGRIKVERDLINEKGVYKSIAAGLIMYLYIKIDSNEQKVYTGDKIRIEIGTNMTNSIKIIDYDNPESYTIYQVK